MPVYNRGGKVLKTGIIGKLNVLRQHLLLPGETLKPNLSGQVRLTPMRERDTTRIHARIDGFLTPVRWLWDKWPDYVKQGDTTTLTIPTISKNPYELGLGGSITYGPMQIYKFFDDSLLRIYNEWYKWPEDNDITSTSSNNMKAINLSRIWTRLQEDNSAKDSETDISTTGANLDIRDLAVLQSKYRNAIERDWLAHQRYIELLGELFNADGSREVDKVPIRLKGAEVGVDPWNRFATNDTGLGVSSAVYDFGVRHNFGMVAAPEHMVLTYILVVRFAPIAGDEVNPMAVNFDKSWAETIGDPGILSAMPPQPVKTRQFAAATNSANAAIRGYAPAGWQFRDGFNVVDVNIVARNSFPLIDQLANQSSKQLRNSMRVEESFLSSSLGDYVVDLWATENVNSPIPSARSSLFSGVNEAGKGSKALYPMDAKHI